MIVLLFPLAFIPIIFIFIWIRNTEKYNRESWFSIIFTFLWGAVIAVSISFLLETAVLPFVSDLLILSVFIAPFIEEFTKPIVLRLFKKDINEIEDGLIYGAVAGLGFAATENLVYGIKFWDQGLIVLLSLIYIRTIGTSLLHASSTALTGYGYSSKIKKKRSFLSIVPFFLLAVAAHSLFNLFSFSAQTVNQVLGVVIAVLFAVSLMIWIKKRITLLDKKHVLIDAE